MGSLIHEPANQNESEDENSNNEPANSSGEKSSSNLFALPTLAAASSGGTSSSNLRTVPSRRTSSSNSLARPSRGTDSSHLPAPSLRGTSLSNKPAILKRGGAKKEIGFGIEVDMNHDWDEEYKKSSYIRGPNGNAHLNVNDGAYLHVDSQLFATRFVNNNGLTRASAEATGPSVNATISRNEGGGFLNIEASVGEVKYHDRNDDVGVEFQGPGASFTFESDDTGFNVEAEVRYWSAKVKCAGVKLEAGDGKRVQVRCDSGGTGAIIPGYRSMVVGKDYVEISNRVASLKVINKGDDVGGESGSCGRSPEPSRGSSGGSCEESSGGYLGGSSGRSSDELFSWSPGGSSGRSSDALFAWSSGGSSGRSSDESSRRYSGGGSSGRSFGGISSGSSGGSFGGYGGPSADVFSFGGMSSGSSGGSFGGYGRPSADLFSSGGFDSLYLGRGS